MSAAALQPTAAPPAPAAAAAPPKRAIAGLVGILIAAMMAGLNNRVGALALADVRGALGFGLDDASWLTTVYSAGEVIAMPFRSEEHTSELQSLMRISYAVFCLKKKKKTHTQIYKNEHKHQTELT